MTKQPSEELLSLELARLESLYAEALKAVRSFTPVLHNGRVVQIPIITSDGQIVTNPEGQPITCIAQDRQPVLAGFACAVRIAERRAKLLGLDAPIRAHNTVSIASDSADMSHLSTAEIEEIKSRLYPSRRLLAPTKPVEATEE